MPRGRPRQFDEQRVLEAALEVFWTRGFEDATLDEVMELGGIGRQSLYDAFGTKSELFAKALESYGHATLSDHRACLEESPSAVDALVALAEGWFATDTPLAGRGCLMVNTLVESRGADETITRIVHEHFGRLLDLIAATLERAIETGELPADYDVRGASACWSTTMLGVALLAKTGDGRGVIEASARRLADELRRARLLEQDQPDA